MNRRKFIQSCTAIFALPVLPSLPALSSPAVASASAVPAQARFWAIYFSGMHGECAPQTLQKALNIPAAEARGYLTQLISDGVIKPNPLLKSSISSIVKNQKDGFVDKLKARMELKSKSAAVDEETETPAEKIALSEEALSEADTGKSHEIEFIEINENIQNESSLEKHETTQQPSI